MKWAVFVLVVACLVGVSGGLTSLHAARDVSVSCYEGNPEDNEYLGTVDVFDVRAAANACNSMYVDCEGRCTGCYDDEDSREVCVDPSGRIYYE
jgi:hypothetical protein